MVVQQSGTENDTLCASWLLKCLCLMELNPNTHTLPKMTAWIQIVFKNKPIETVRKVIMFVSVKIRLADGVDCWRSLCVVATVAVSARVRLCARPFAGL